MELYKRRMAPVWAVQFNGDLEDLDELLRDTRYTLHARRDSGVWQLAKNGIPTLLLLEGEWVVRQRNGDVQIFSQAQFQNEYEKVS